MGLVLLSVIFTLVCVQTAQTAYAEVFHDHVADRGGSMFLYQLHEAKDAGKLFWLALLLAMVVFGGLSIFFGVILVLIRRVAGKQLFLFRWSKPTEQKTKKKKPQHHADTHPVIKKTNPAKTRHFNEIEQLDPKLPSVMCTRIVYNSKTFVQPTNKPTVTTSTSPPPTVSPSPSPSPPLPSTSKMPKLSKHKSIPSVELEEAFMRSLGWNPEDSTVPDISEEEKRATLQRIADLRKQQEGAHNGPGKTRRGMTAKSSFSRFGFSDESSGSTFV